jgi:hypothetical protein
VTLNDITELNTALQMNSKIFEEALVSRLGGLPLMMHTERHTEVE